MEAEKNTELGICYECQTKNGDASKKTVHRCDLCGKWFCQLHRNAKFPYFVDWETQFNVQGNPAVKAMFYSEYGRKDGHADFVYLRQTIEQLEKEKQIQNQLIEKNVDRMVKANKIRSEIAAEKAAVSIKIIPSYLLSDEDNPLKKTTKTYENIFGHEFSVPKEVYADKIFREKLNTAHLLCEAEAIIAEFYNRKVTPQQETKTVQTQKKKHWWQ